MARQRLNPASPALAGSLATLALAFAPLSVAAQSAAPSFGECENIVNEEELRAQVAAGARAAMRAAAKAVDYKSVVEQSWSAVNFDAKFAEIVDAQIAILRQDRPYLERLLDGNIPSRAEEMAKKTADAVFTSPAFIALQTELQEDIGRRLAPMVQGADLKAQSRATECVRVFLGRRYASTVSTAFGAEAGTATIKPKLEAGSAGTAAVFSLAGIVAGMLTIIFRRLVRRIVAAVVRRLAGAIAARLAAWASVVLGAALLVYELVAGAEGVFPIIKEQLTGPETAKIIRTSLVEELSTVAPDQLDARAQEIADTMIVGWRKFRANHRAVLELAEREERFRKFLEEQPPENFETLSVVINSIKQTPPGGDKAVLDALDRGLLARALLLPGIAKLIETWTPQGVSVIDLLAWRDRTGDRFQTALDANLPLHVKPDELSKPALDRLLSLNAPSAAERIAGMEEPARSEALELETAQLVALTTRFDARQLTGLFDSIRPAATPEARAEHLRTLLERPGLITRLDDAGTAVSSSQQPSVALEILLSTSSSWNPGAVLSHASSVWNGAVSPLVLVHRYGWGLWLIVLIPLIVAIWILRWLGRSIGLLGRRR